MNTYQSREDYLERILVLSEKLEYVRSIDLALDMNFSKPSISIMMKKLKNDNLINIDEKGHITLTKEGLVIAKNIYERHIILTKFLISIGVDEETAKKDACEIEHDISPITFESIKKIVNK